MQSDLAAVLARLDKITKGPWRVGADKAPYLIPIREHAMGAPIIAWAEGGKNVERAPDETEANARAIALVPELRDCAKALHRIVNSGFSAQAEYQAFGALSALAKRGME